MFRVSCSGRGLQRELQRFRFRNRSPHRHYLAPLHCQSLVGAQFTISCRSCSVAERLYLALRAARLYLYFARHQAPYIYLLPDH